MVTKCRLDRKNPDERRDQIIALAAEVFAQEGYGATSMATIAARVGGSKATLYKYFPSKEALFEAVMAKRGAHVLAPLRELRGGAEDALEPLLVDFGVRFLTKIYAADAQDLFRLVHAEGFRFPELSRAFFRAGPDTVVEELAATLRRFVARGQIVCADPVLAAGQFLGMLRGQRHLRFATGVIGAPDAATIAADAAHAARIFVAGLTPPRGD